VSVYDKIVVENMKKKIKMEIEEIYA